MPNADDELEAAYRHARRIAVMESAQAVLEWDERTGMPVRAGEYRADQLAELAAVTHELRVDAAYGERLESLAAAASSSGEPSRRDANVIGLLRDYRRRAKLSSELVAELTRETARGQQLWDVARAADDFAIFAPQLQRILDLKREEADAVGYETCRYDALLDEYEPGATVAELGPALAALREPLSELAQQIFVAPAQPDESLLRGDFPPDSQRTLADEAAAAIGYEFARGGAGETSHPFCTTLGPHDARIATRFLSNDFSDGFFSTIHEAGHAMYEQGLPAEDFGLPTGQAASLGIHESQSRLWENSVARSEGFWRHIFPKWRAAFPAARCASPREAYAAVNTVRSSLIRTESDEVTYNLHILIRFELEQALLSGDLPVADLPGAWREQYLALLGIEPPNHADGELQDVHWSAGLFGYFPTYTLGNLYAAQIMEAAEATLGDLDAAFAEGEFSGLLGWLREHVHQWGRTYSAQDLVQRATGKPPSAAPLLTRLSLKYRRLYGLD